MSFMLYGLIVLLAIILGTQATSPKPRFAFECHENGKGKFAANDTYEINLVRALSRLVQRSSRELGGNYGFYNSSYGQNPYTVYAAGLCRGDVGPGLCTACLQKSSRHLIDVCPNEREAIGGYEECVVRYSNRFSNDGLLETHTRAYNWNGRSMESNHSDAFFQNLKQLLNERRDQASGGGPLGKYSTGNIRTMIGSGAQCTPVLSRFDCKECLDGVFVDVRRFHGMLGWRVITPSCNFRLEVYKFYGVQVQPHNSAPPPLTTQVLSRTSAGNASGIGGFALSSATVVLIIAVGVYTRVKKTNKNRENDSSGDVEEIIGSVGYLKFDLSTIKVATNNFSERKMIGQSKVGVVYKGTLGNGQEVAVKHVDTRLHRVYFRNEILCGSKLFHRNLVRLFGFCSKGDINYLVYEFLPNKLHRVLFDDQRTNLNWDTRYKIINGIARALLYLHEDSGLVIAHGDIRSSKILMDEHLNPKISCFGSADNFVKNIRSDVFSFGVLILEIVRRHSSTSHTESFLNEARRSWREGTALDLLVDPRIRDGSDSESIIRCIRIALLCIQVEADCRPTMSSVVLMLSSNSLILPDIQNESEEGPPLRIDPSNSENSLSFPIGNEADESSLSSNSFVSASDSSLSPTSERGSHDAEPGQLNRSARSSYFRGIGSLWLKLFLFQS